MRSVLFVMLILSFVPVSFTQEIKTARRSEIRTMGLEALLEKLRSDDVRRNALYATLYLYEFPSPPVIERLHELLDSDDWQQRQLAAWLLRREQPIPITERLVEVTVEGLRDDALPYSDEGHNTFVCNAEDGAKMFLHHPLEFLQPLVNALSSDDVQQQYWAAVILARHQHAESFEQTVPVLIRHIHDDDIYNNAFYAAYALFHAGTEIREQIEPLLESDDAQVQEISSWILATWDDPDASVYKRPDGFGRPVYSQMSWNPLFHLANYYVIRIPENY